MFEWLSGKPTKLEKANLKIEELETEVITLMNARDSANVRADRYEADAKSYEESMHKIGREYSSCISENTGYLDKIKELEEEKVRYEADEVKARELHESLDSMSKVDEKSTRPRKKS